MSVSQESHRGVNGIAHVDPSVAHRMSIDNMDTNQINFDAAKATEAEHNVSLWHGLKLYPKSENCVG
ncbi:hypothetical protein B5807_02529 [Epicoccum nigrum]|uniref:Uncharacterized protein n=1 Tax=Epicoccum nigrum TaxID=105696 RepID=A0A1Y2MAP8_EPING|nr:hypothetical protein B5807_02529 [Epicoccum nigrum]